VKKLEVVLRVVKIFKKKMKKKKIKIKVDNQIALTYINKIIRKVSKIAKITRKIVEIAESVGATVIAVYIPSKENKKVDLIFRLKDFYN
jgi:hypothetical protein